MIRCHDCRWLHCWTGTPDMHQSVGRSYRQCEHDSCFSSGQVRSALDGVRTISRRITDYESKNKNNDCANFEWRSRRKRRKARK